MGMTTIITMIKEKWRMDQCMSRMNKYKIFYGQKNTPPTKALFSDY
jgi:hypothetical protein